MITHVEHELVSPAVEAIAADIAAERAVALAHVPDMSGTMTPAMMSMVMRSLTPLVVGVGAAPVDPTPLMLHVSDTHTTYDTAGWKSKQPSKPTYSHKRRKSTMRRNRK